MDFYAELKKIKDANNYTFAQLGIPIGLKEAAMRMAVSRQSLSDLQKREIASIFKLDYERKSNNTVGDIDIEEKVKEFSDFFVKYESRCMEDPNIKNIVEKRVAKKLFEVSQNSETLREFLNS